MANLKNEAMDELFQGLGWKTDSDWEARYKTLLDLTEVEALKKKME